MKKFDTLEDAFQLKIP